MSFSQHVRYVSVPIPYIVTVPFAKNWVKIIQTYEHDGFADSYAYQKN